LSSDPFCKHNKLTQTKQKANKWHIFSVSCGCSYREFYAESCIRAEEAESADETVFSLELIKRLKILSEAEILPIFMERIDFLKNVLGLPFGIGTIAAKKLQKTEQAPRCLLNKFYVAGFQYYKGPSIIGTIKTGETLKLIAGRENYYDQFAVKIMRKGLMLGHVPRTDNKHISRLLQQNIKLCCKVAQVNPDRETWQMLKVRIYL
jgi:hypothetical protein